MFSIGLPTLVLLNMSDQLAARGGQIDTLALARELGHPVALISAAQGKGLEAIQTFYCALEAASTTGCGLCSCRCCRARRRAGSWVSTVTSESGRPVPCGFPFATCGSDTVEEGFRTFVLSGGCDCCVSGGVLTGSAAE